MNSNDEAWKVFWCEHLSPVMLGEVPEGQREAYFRTLSERDLLVPGGKMRRFSVRTWRRRWTELKKGGVAALGQRRRRSDRGRPRQVYADLLKRAEQLKREQPRRSDQVINRILRREFGREVPRSTLYRHLKRVGATRLRLGIAREKIRCRWTRDHSNALWVGDFSEGPVVVHRGQAVKTHLSAWIDCHSRYVVEARYYVRENLDVLVDSLLRAWARHGASRELYVDNAKIYHAGKLKLATTQLNIKLLHRPPRDAPAGGLIERFFQTLQGQLEAEIRAAEVFSLDQLNAALMAWLRTAYHQEIHSETGQTPEDRYEEAQRFTRHVNLREVIGFFHERAPRTVNEEFIDVQIEGQFFKVDYELRGERILVEWDPFQADAGLDEVQLYRPDGTYLGVGKKHRREKREQPPAPGSSPPIKPHYIDALLADAAVHHAQSRELGVDYHSAQQRNVWSLSSFAGQFVRLLGRHGGLSALSAEELEALRAFHARHARLLQEGLLREAFSRADQPSVGARQVDSARSVSPPMPLGRKERLMYLEHFQLKSQPFAEHAAAAALWADARMNEGLARLEYLVRHGEVGLVTGVSGVGKSALVKRFLHGLGPQQCHTVYCHLTQLPSAGLLKLVATQLGEAPRRGKERLFEQILERARRAEGALLLVFDEAHLLSAESLTDLRLLVSSALEIGPPLKILLAGQEPLRATLKRAVLADLANRVSVRFQLRPLTKDQTVRYIDFQLTAAGGDTKIIDDSVKSLIHDFTGGIPRYVNNVAVACLMQATAQKLPRVDDDVFQHAVGEFQLP